MNDHSQSRYRLNPLPGEEQPAAQKSTTPGIATLPPLDDDQEPWTAIPPPAAPPVQHTQAVAGQAFCQFCGGRAAPDAVLCLSCGRQIKALQGATAEAKADDKPASAVGFLLMVVLTLAFPLAGFIFGISGLSRPGKQAQGGVLMALSIIFGTVYFFALMTPHH